MKKFLINWAGNIRVTLVAICVFALLFFPVALVGWAAATGKGYWLLGGVVFSFGWYTALFTLLSRGPGE